ncbi:ABC transporter permease subunit [Oscillospiraceae bacterium HV4-5-C5C]|nr:ABC transporter permease subunit [Oscillospiraceae bacterium HV4-5-C5C]
MTFTTLASNKNPAAPPPLKPGRAARQLRRFWAWLFWLLLWELGSRLIAPELRFLVASPTQVLRRLIVLGSQASFWWTAGRTLLRISLGFMLGAVTAILLAVLSFHFNWVREWLAPLLLFIKSTPVASIIILILILLPSRYLAIFIAFLMVLPILYSALYQGLEQTDSQLLELAQVFELPWTRRLKGIYLPEILPYFKSAAASALGLAWKAGVAGEVIGIPQGSIGEQLYNAKINLSTPDLFAWTLVVICLSLLGERLFMKALNSLQRQISR